MPRSSIPPPASQYRQAPSPVYNNQNKSSLQPREHTNRLSNGHQPINQTNNHNNNHLVHHQSTNNQSSSFIKSNGNNLSGHSGPKPYSGSDITRRPLRLAGIVLYFSVHLIRLFSIADLIMIVLCW